MDRPRAVYARPQSPTGERERAIWDDGAPSSVSATSYQTTASSRAAWRSTADSHSIRPGFRHSSHTHDDVVPKTRLVPKSKQLLQMQHFDTFAGNVEDSGPTLDAETGNAPKFQWEVFEGDISAKKLRNVYAAVLRGPEFITKYLGMVNINMVQVSRWSHEDYSMKLFAHFWKVRPSASSLLRVIVWGIFLPLLINLLMTLPPLHELSDPPGSDGFLPFKDIWGWLLQKAIAIVLVDMIIIPLQLIYLSPSDHFYFSLFPTAIKVLVTLIAQDFIPRALNAFPVNLLDSAVGPTLCGVVAFYHCWVFVFHKLPQYEKGTAKPSFFETIISGGLNTNRFKRQLTKHIAVSRKETRMQHPDMLRQKSISRIRSHSANGKLEGNSAGIQYIPSYILFGRRRMLVLMLLLCLYIAFYLSCVAFLLFFRLTEGSDTLQGMLSVGFALVSVFFRKLLAPALFKKAKFGGRWFDGKTYSRYLDTKEKAYDHQLNASGFRLADYYFECLSEVFLTFILPEISANWVFALLILLEIISIVVTGGVWIFMLPGWTRTATERKLRRINSGIVAPKAIGLFSPQNQQSRPNLARQKPQSKRVSPRLNVMITDKEHIMIKEAKRYYLSGVVTGIPPRENVELICRYLFRLRNPYLKNQIKSYARTPNMKMLKLPDTHWTTLRNQCVTRTDKAERLIKGIPQSNKKAFLNEWASRWISPLIGVWEKTDESLNKEMISKDKRPRRNSIGRVEMYPVESTAPDLRAHTQFDWSVSSADEELVLLGWAISRCQTLFAMFFADLYATMSFLFLFTFMVFGYNSESFPYSGMCMDQYRVVMQYNAIAFVATLAGIGLCDLYLRRRLGISLVSAGMTLFTHGQTIVCMTITASLAYALVWSFIADHTYVLLFFIERISALSTGGLC